ncbi:MAG TPA: serine hydrolase, partial [Gemmatimonadaceae bacterium]
MTKREAPVIGATAITPRERTLRHQIEKIEKESGATAIAVALRDFETGLELHYHADRWFHAASTIKVPILLGVFAAIDRGELLPHSRCHVRNRFLSCVENIPFRVESGRDSNSAVHNAIGKMMRVDELAYHMITTSSNLATNLLLGVMGTEAVNETLKELHLDKGIELRRGVEDELAFEKR